jgi:serine/threonine protein kinase
MLFTLTIPGYEITEIIHEGVNTVVYRGLSQGNQEKVIIKVLKAEYPTLEQISRLTQEHSITENLDLLFVVKILRLEAHQNRLVLVSEDFGGISLNEYLKTTLFNNKEGIINFLSIEQFQRDNPTAAAQAWRQFIQQLLTESVNDGLSIVDLETARVITINPKAYNLYGYSYEEFIALKPTDFIHADFIIQIPTK